MSEQAGVQGDVLHTIVNADGTIETHYESTTEHNDCLARLQAEAAQRQTEWEQGQTVDES